MIFSEWQQVKLDTVCERVSVGYVGTTTPYFCDETIGIPLIRSQNVRPGKLDLTDVKYVTPEFHRQTRKSNLQAGDILIVRVGQNRGDCCIVPEGMGELNCANVVFARPKPYLSKFLSFFFRSPIGQHILLSLSTGSAQGVLNTTAIADLPVPLPPAEEAQKIAAVLSSLDDKIDLLHRQNKTLEDLAQTLFRHWFVDGARDDWESHKLEEFVEVMRGLSYKGAGLTDEGDGIPMHNLNSVYEGGGYKYEGLKYYNGPYQERHRVFPGDIILTNTEQGHDFLLIGYPAIVPRNWGNDGIFSQHIYRLKVFNPQISNQFLYYLLMSFDVREQIIGATNGSTVNMLPKDGIEWATFKLPPQKHIHQFSEMVQQYWDKKEANYKQIKTLENLRNTLLPKLMSGEVRVRL